MDAPGGYTRETFSSGDAPIGKPEGPVYHQKDPQMSQSPSLGQHDIHVWYADLSSYRERCVLSEDEYVRAARLRAPVDHERFIAAHSLWRSIIGAYLAVSPEELAFAQAPLGKPYVRSPRVPLRFSGSHSQHLTAIALAWEVEIGLDIEYAARPLVDASGIATIAFSGDERRRLAAVPADKQMEGLLRGWTQKEAMAKALGQGLHAELNQIPASLDACRPFESLPGWQIVPLSPGERAVASLAAPHGTHWQVSEGWWSERSC